MNFEALKNTINTMVDQLNGFAAELTRVARDVGTKANWESRRSYQVSAVPGRTLTDWLMRWARILTAQVRSIAEVATAVARGDLSKKITVDVHGEILELKEYDQYHGEQLNGSLRLGGHARGPGGRDGREARRAGGRARRRRHLEGPDG